MRVRPRKTVAIRKRANPLSLSPSLSLPGRLGDSRANGFEIFADGLAVGGRKIFVGDRLLGELFILADWASRPSLLRFRSRGVGGKRLGFRTLLRLPRRSGFPAIVLIRDPWDLSRDPDRLHSPAFFATRSELIEATTYELDSLHSSAIPPLHWPVAPELIAPGGILRLWLWAAALEALPGPFASPAPSGRGC